MGDEEDEDDYEYFPEYDPYQARVEKQRRELKEQIKRLKQEAEAREEARKASQPEIWEINRAAGADDRYRLLEQTWRMRYMAYTVQLSSLPRYRTVFPSDDKWEQMKQGVRCVAADRKRRLSRRHPNSKSDI